MKLDAIFPRLKIIDIPLINHGIVRRGLIDTLIRVMRRITPLAHIKSHRSLNIALSTHAVAYTAARTLHLLRRLESQSPLNKPPLNKPIIMYLREITLSVSMRIVTPNLPIKE